MSDLDNVVKSQIEQLSKVEISTDLIDRIDVGKLSNKAKELVRALSESNESLEELINKGKFKSFIHSLSGKNDKTLANAEKAVVDATQFNIGLSLLLVLFSKAIKNQQDVLATQQVDILKIQGLTKEQADKIVEILQAGEFVKKRIEEARNELNSNMDTLENNILEKIGEVNEYFESKTNNINAELLSLLHTENENILSNINVLSSNINDLNCALISETKNLKEIIEQLKKGDINNLQERNLVLEKKVLLALSISSISFVLLILKLFNVV
jgi:hypothetical protein